MSEAMHNTIRNKNPLLLVVLLLPLFGIAQAVPKPLTLHQLSDSMAVRAKPVLITIYTSWCKYCKMQEAQIKKSKMLSHAVASDVYWVALNAEDREHLMFDGMLYSFDAAAGVHALATKLSGSNEVVFPSVIFLDAGLKTVYVHRGVMEEKLIYRILQGMLSTSQISMQM
jgi:thioredoxin-related protein